MNIENEFWEPDCLIDKIHDRVINLAEDTDRFDDEVEEMDQVEDDDDLGVTPLPR